MSKNANNVTVNTTTATMTTNNTTTIKKQEESTMKKATTNATTAMTAAEFKQKSYDAYLVYVAFIEGKQGISETVEALSPLMAVYGLELTADNLANLLTVKLTSYGKVKSISTFRAFVKGAWKDVAAAPIHSNAGRNPADAKPSAKAKKPTKAELEAELETLRAQMAALTKANTEKKAA